MWIRSQDKNSFYKYIGFEIGDNVIKATRVDSKVILVGKYSTEEKALKVLDMIQEHIKPKYMLDKENMVVSIPQNNVFQMPQDSEVIV